MAFKHDIPTGAARESLIAQAARIDARRSVLEPSETTPVSAATVHRAAHQGDRDALAAVLRAAAETPALRRLLDRELSRAAYAASGALRVASTGDVDEREADGYRVMVRSSSARPGAAFLIVEALDGAPAPARLTASTADAVEMVELPDAVDGVVQTTLPADHPALALIRDPAATILFFRPG